jgi:uncharacterized protein involved in exopolysaccharide biosynthesis
MSSAQPTPREQLERLVFLVRRATPFWKRAFLVFLLGVGLAVPYVFTRPRDYKSETVILYHETMHSADLTGGEGGSDSSRRVGARLREVLLSRTSLEPIIDDLHLFQDSIIRGERIGAVEEMRRHITFRSRDGDTFEISFVGSTPQQAQEVTRRLGETIVQEASSRRTDQAKTLKEFLNTESTRNEAELKQKESELARFVVLHPEFASRAQGLQGGAAGTSPTSTAAGAAAYTPPRFGDPVLNALEARAARIDRQLRGPTAPNGAKPAATFQTPPDSPELVSARRDLADKLARFTDKHPDVVAAKNRVKTAEQAQAASNEAAAAAFAAQQAATRDDGAGPKNAADEAALRKELADIHQQIAGRRFALAKPTPKAAGGAPSAEPAPAVVPSGPVELETEFRRLQREVTERRDQQDKLNDKLFRASITASSVMNDRNIQVSILDPAYLPVRPVSKPRTVLLGGLLVAAFALALATAVASAFLDDRIYDRKDLERFDVLPVLGVIPKMLPPKRGDDG